jgi:hypothetical protein
MRITLEPLPPAEREAVTAPLLEGRAADTRSLAEHLSDLRTPKPRRGTAA